MENEFYGLNKEDRAIKYILETINCTDGYMVEIGAEDGYRFSNIRYFLNKGWKGIQLNKWIGESPPPELKEEFITAENINDILDKYEVPKELAVLSLDIDGNDYWVFKNLNRKAMVVCVEYNSGFPFGVKKVLEYQPDLGRETNRAYGTMAFSASFSAWIDLLEEKGYKPIYESDFCNIIAVDKDIVQGKTFNEFNNIKWVDSVKDNLPHQTLDPAPEAKWIDISCHK